MKWIINKLILAFVGVAALSACDSVRKFTIEVREPSPITLPAPAGSVVILNNAVPQPANLGIEQELGGIRQTVDPEVRFDSLTWNTVNTLADVLGESDFFRKVSVFEDPIRSDTEWLTMTSLAPELRDLFFETEGFDILLTIDRQIFRIVESVRRNRFGFENLFVVDLRGDVVTVCSIYLSGRETPFKTFTFSDSIVYKDALAEDYSDVFKKLPVYLLSDLSYLSGEHAALHFLPKWKQTERFIFTSQSARMLEADSYAKSQMWAKAEQCWKSEYDRHNKPVDKARIAVNIAVANEMQDKLNEALTWAEKASQHLETNYSSQYPKEKSAIKDYIKELHKRIQNNRVLDLQSGIGN